MTDQQRTVIPDSIRTNGLTPNPWWSNAVVYQIYPRSFQDSNRDGIGDIPGIISRLDELAELGIDVIWLSPVYKSPQMDNGYDVADYEQIDPIFGTMDDMMKLIHEAHRRGIRLIMDLVVNHTSDQHPWFRASKDAKDPHADWYWWRPARPGHIPGTPGAEPNRWGGTFGGSAWTYDPQRGEYYLHTFSRQQPDLNWENPTVRHAIYAMMNRWLDRGIDGFRMDVITLISKTIDKNGKLPGEYESLIPDNPVGEEGYSSPWPFSMDGPRLDEYLQEMRRAVFQGRSGYMTVGEGQGISPQRDGYITDPHNHELDMLFLFDHVSCDQDGAKWNSHPLHLQRLKDAMEQTEKSVSDYGWASLYFNNHDQPRSVSRWGDDRTPESCARSAKALALLLHMHRGTPYIYQGEEIGMTNAHFTRLDQYRDVESLNAFHQRVEEAHVQSASSMMKSLAAMGRDNSRTPMQWDNSRYAGFTDANAQTKPWISVNPNKDIINVRVEKQDSNSVWSFYQQLIKLRHENVVISAGNFSLLDKDDPNVYSILRTTANHSVLALINVSSSSSMIPAQSSQYLSDKFRHAKFLIGTDPSQKVANSIQTGVLAPWMAFAMEV